MFRSLLAAAVVGLSIPVPVQSGTPTPAPSATQASAERGQQMPATPQEWSAVARRDIEAAYLILRDNHPGMVDHGNAGFSSQLDRARRSGLASADRVTTPMGYDAAIAVFGNALQDGHAGVYTTLPQALRPARQWPGFVPVWRSGRLIIHSSEEAGAPRGAQIVSCDGTSIAALAQQNVFRFRGRPSEPGNWWLQARNVLVDTGNPFVTRPSACRLRQDNRSWTVSLRWRTELGSTFSAWRVTSYNGATLPIGFSTPASGIAWIAMTNFDPDAAGIEAYRRLNATLDSQYSAISRSRAIVLDLRDNEGGSSSWSLDIAKRLWGGDPVDTQMRHYFARTSIEWRATVGNEAYLRATVPSIRDAGFAEIADQWLAIADQMAAARASNVTTVTETLRGAGTPLPAIVPTTLTTPVYVIVPGQCASACLDALDVFTRFANTRLIGAPSSGDSKYMEVRQQALPSGLASVTIPVKMWVNRPRGHGVGYRPDIAVDALDWSIEDFLRIVEIDLAASNRSSR